MMETIVDTQNNENNEIIESGERIASISRVYLLLGRFFSYPDEGLYETMKGAQAQEDLRTLVEGLPFEVDFKGIPSPSLPLDEFESEYINTFDITPPIPLYEYDYRGGELTRRDILEELLRFYEQFGIKLSDKEKDYPDHLVAELEFMAFLAQKEADSKERGKAPDPYRLAQLDFLERHLDKWVYKLDERIQKRCKEPFYKGASSFMVEFLRSHLSYLKTLNNHWC